MPARFGQPRPLYGADLAWIQHVAFGDFARRSAPGLRALLRAAGIRAGRVVDLGCGDGGWLGTLSRAGYEAMGIEPSPELVRIARRVAPGARVVLGRAHTARLPSCDAVTAIGEVLGYCPPGRKGRPPLGAVLRRVHAALRPGGLLVFDLLVAGPGPALSYRTWTAGRGWAVLVEVREDRRGRRLTRDIVTFRRRGAGWRRRQERHELAVYTRAEVEALARAAGFTVRTRRSYGRVELLPRRLAFIARRG